MLGGLQATTSAAEKLRTLGKQMEAFADGAQGLFPLFMEYWASSQQRAESAQLWAGLLTEFKDVLVGIIQEGVEAGEFRPVDAENLVWAMMAAYDGLAAYTLLLPDMDLAAASEALVDTLITGLLAE
jgi:hypothetical protein